MKSFFSPIDLSQFHLTDDECLPTIAQHAEVYTADSEFPDLQKSRLVIFGVPEDRLAVRNKGCAEAADKIRAKLYPLVVPCEEMHIADLGNMIVGDTPQDTYTALTEIMSELIDRGKTVLVLGGSQDLTYPLYGAYAKLSRVINIASVDSRFDLGGNELIDSRNYLKHIIMQQPNFLFNYTNIGFQTYFVGNSYIKLMEELRFQAYRLGVVQKDMLSAEPLLRNADLVSIDMAAVRQSDAPAHGDPSPHGFYGEQLCQLVRFAGMSDKTTCLLLSELNPVYDRDNQTAHLAAHAIWHFIEGFYARKSDFPYRDKQNYKRYAVQLEEHDVEILFYKSKKSDRWWMEVPCSDDERRERYGQHLLIPCNYSDYERAMHNEIPEIWWQYYAWLNE